MAATGAVGKSIGAKAASAKPVKHQQRFEIHMRQMNTYISMQRCVLIERHTLCAVCIPRIFARGLMLYFLAAASVRRTRAAAPSLSVLALAAVIVPPSGLKAGLRAGNFVKSALGGRENIKNELPSYNINLKTYQCQGGKPDTGKFHSSYIGMNVCGSAYENGCMVDGTCAMAAD